MNKIDSFSGEYRFLSNFWMAPLTINDWTFESAEHAYQAAKSTDPIMWRHIQKDCLTAGQAKRAGMRLQMRPDWNQIKYSAMEQILAVKFADPYLAQRLLDTGDAELVEGNTWGDTYWGVCKHIGQNNLGKLLMKQRTILRDSNMVFVFGSNLSGIHGAGAARYAHEFLGAQLGVGEGITGKCYALPTKGLHITFMEPFTIETHVNKFLAHAKATPDTKYKVTQVGCGLSRIHPELMARMFKDAPENCYFDTQWAKYLGSKYKYWGTF